MPKELFWLTLTAALTGLLWVPYILDRIAVRGLMGALANPSPADKPQSGWADRMMAAHVNAVENLIVFAPLVLTAHALGISPKTLDIFRGKVKRKFKTTMHGIPRVWFCALIG